MACAVAQRRRCARVCVRSGSRRQRSAVTTCACVPHPGLRRAPAPPPPLPACPAPPSHPFPPSHLLCPGPPSLYRPPLSPGLPAPARPRQERALPPTPRNARRPGRGHSQQRWHRVRPDRRHRRGRASQNASATAPAVGGAAAPLCSARRMPIAARRPPPAACEAASPAIACPPARTACQVGGVLHALPGHPRARARALRR